MQQLPKNPLRFHCVRGSVIETNEVPAPVIYGVLLVVDSSLLGAI